MACTERLEITQLETMDASSRSPSHNDHPPAVGVMSNHTHFLSSPDQQPNTHLHVEEWSGSEEDRVEAAWPRRTGTDASFRAGDGEGALEEGQRRSVLSRLQRPVSRARSSLSAHSAVLSSVSTGVKSVLLRMANQVRRPRRQDDEHSDGYLSSSSVSDPEGSLHSWTNKKKLDSLAGSASKVNFPHISCLPFGRGQKDSKVTCDYFIDPSGKLVP